MKNKEATSCIHIRRRQVALKNKEATSCIHIRRRQVALKKRQPHHVYI